MIDEAQEAQAVAGGGPLQHLLVAVGIAEGEDRAPSDEMIDAFGLSRPVIDEEDLRHLDQHRACVPHLKFSDARGADDLLWWNAVGLVGEVSHELDAAA